MNTPVKTSGWNFDETLCISVTLVVTRSVAKFGLPQSVLYLFKGYNNTRILCFWTTCFNCTHGKFPLKVFHLYIATNKAYFEEKWFWTETSESWRIYKVWTGMTSSALETFPSCFLFVFENAHPGQSRMSVKSPEGYLWCHLRWALIFTSSSNDCAAGGRCHKASIELSCIHVQGNGGRTVIYPKQTFTRL